MRGPLRPLKRSVPVTLTLHDVLCTGGQCKATAAIMQTSKAWRTRSTVTLPSCAGSHRLTTAFVYVAWRVTSRRKTTVTRPLQLFYCSRRNASRDDARYACVEATVSGSPDRPQGFQNRASVLQAGRGRAQRRQPQNATRRFSWCRVLFRGSAPGSQVSLRPCKFASMWALYIEG